MKPCSNTKHSSHPKPVPSPPTHPTGWNPKRPAGRVGRIHRQLAFQKLLPCGRNVNIDTWELLCIQLRPWKKQHGTHHKWWFGSMFFLLKKCAQAQVVLGGLSYNRNTPISICPMYIYILWLDPKWPSFGVFNSQNRKQTGSRYVRSFQWKEGG